MFLCVNTQLCGHCRLRRMGLLGECPPNALPCTLSSSDRSVLLSERGGLFKDSDSVPFVTLLRRRRWLRGDMAFEKLRRVSPLKHWSCWTTSHHFEIGTWKSLVCITLEAGVVITIMMQLIVLEIWLMELFIVKFIDGIYTAQKSVQFSCVKRVGTRLPSATSV